MIAADVENRIRTILQDLESVRENLLTLSDDVWLSIDHNDNTALEQGIEFKREYNEKTEQFARIAEDISVMVQQFTNIRSSDQTSQTTESSEEVRDRIIAELDARTPHNLSEDFTYKRPIGYRLRDHAVTGTMTWRALYEDLLGHLNDIDSIAFQSLPDRQEQVSSRGNPHFAKDPKTLRVASRLAEGLYIEINLSANSIVSMIQIVLPFFGFGTDEMQVYLREDRDA